MISSFYLALNQYIVIRQHFSIFDQFACFSNHYSREFEEKIIKWHHLFSITIHHRTRWLCQQWICVAFINIVSVLSVCVAVPVIPPNNCQELR